MSLQDDQQIAARRIQRAWIRYVYREVFKYFKYRISHWNQQDPRRMLKTVNPREAELLDAAAGVFIRFRLGGMTFPPSIYYKIFTHRPITDVCASSPRNYARQGLKQPAAPQSKRGLPVGQEDRSGWYQRMENNSWRLFCCKVVPTADPAEVGANKKKDFHYSKLQRRRDVDEWRKRRKIKWLMQMYNRGRLQTDPEHGCMATMEENSAQKGMGVTEEKGDDETPKDWELEELLAWTNTLNFEDYMEEWRCLACSHSSERSIDVHPHPSVLDPHEPAAAAVADDDDDDDDDDCDDAAADGDSY
ncbi:protein MFI isoform X3 [Acanthopagrus latus]|uniref:protein MFI isoform X3 n=1 Tax=Acanthopagrus latus TaxID=8177 RepID=UPI00187C4FF7|nr:protein MFI isoform X3 [Acanthopagrus latus]